VASSDLSSLAVLEGMPTTIFVNAAGKVVFVHTGEYDTAAHSTTTSSTTRWGARPSKRAAWLGELLLKLAVAGRELTSPSA